MLQLKLKLASHKQYILINTNVSVLFIWLLIYMLSFKLKDKKIDVLSVL